MPLRRKPSRRAPRRKRVAVATKSYVKRMITYRQDDKYFSLANGYSVADTGQVVDISNIPQSTTATDDSSRIGDDLILKKIDLKYQITNGDPTNNVRVILFQTKDRFTVAPLTTDVLRNLFGTVRAPLAPLYFDGRKRIKILYDRLVPVDTYNPIRNGRIVVYPSRLARKKINYYAGSALDKEGGIYLMLVSDSSVSSHPTFQFAGDIFFTG